jgi:hypothetical protein
MTEPTPDAPDANATPDVGTADDSLDLPQNLDQAKNLRSENRALRQRMKAAEEGFEQASAQLTAMRRNEVERVAADHLVDPSDFWNAHTDVDGFLTEAGTVDPARVTEAAQEITAVKPHLAAPQKITAPPSDRPVEGLRSGARPDARTSGPTWAEAIGR